MRIGTDISIAACRQEGYPVIEYNKKGLFPDGGPMNKDYGVKVTISWGERWTDAGRPILGYCHEELWIINDTICFSTLIEIFEDYGDDIKSFCDFESCPINLDNPTEYDFLSLVSAIEGYSGLTTWGLGPHG